MSCKIGSQCYIDSKGIDLENKTVKVILSDETKVMRFSWEEGVYDLTLEHSEDAIDLTRKDILPVLLQHNTDMLPLGIYEDVRLEDGKLKATARFDSEDELAMEVFGKMSRGFLQTLSVGVTIHSKELVGKQDNKNTYKATRWEITEASVVTVPAIPNAKVGLSVDEVENMGGTSAEAIPSDNVKLVNSKTGENMEFNQQNFDDLQEQNKLLSLNKTTIDNRNTNLSLQVENLTADLDAKTTESADLTEKLSVMDGKLSEATATGANEAKATFETRLNEAFETGVASQETILSMISADNAEAASKIALDAKESDGATHQSDGGADMEAKELAYAKEVAKKLSV